MAVEISTPVRDEPPGAPCERRTDKRFFLETAEGTDPSADGVALSIVGRNDGDVIAVGDGREGVEGTGPDYVFAKFSHSLFLLCVGVFGGCRVV
ncbi:MAG: hypothetical protein AAGB11_20615 [Pseudomonadota bacterium]